MKKYAIGHILVSSVFAIILGVITLFSGAVALEGYMPVDNK
ncbi:hypothetical protein [Streptococcus ovis]|nr:hypothetical protein [Streptococcus ovis]